MYAGVISVIHSFLHHVWTTCWLRDVSCYQITLLRLLSIFLRSFCLLKIRLGSVSYGVESPASDDEKLKDMQQSSVECERCPEQMANKIAAPLFLASLLSLFWFPRRKSHVQDCQDRKTWQAKQWSTPLISFAQELLKGFDIVVVGLSCLSYDFELAAKIDETCRSLGRITATTAHKNRVFVVNPSVLAMLCNEVLALCWL